MSKIIELKNGDKLESQGYAVYIQNNQEPHKFSYRNETGELKTVHVRPHRYGFESTLEKAQETKEKWESLDESESVTVEECYDYYYED
jgi:hypothetical protein